MKKPEKLIIIGLDGATFDVLDPLLNAGKLPQIQQLITEGCFGELRSTYPPVTGPAWIAIATGLNPGNTGAYDFFSRRKGSSLETKPISSDLVAGKTFWDYLGNVGLRSIIFNYPMLYPAYEINGFMVSGLGSPMTKHITYPPSLIDELNACTGGYKTGVPSYKKKKYMNNEDEYLQFLNRSLDLRIEAAKYLLKEKEWDLFMMVLNETDFIQHYLWKHWDSTHPDYQNSRSSKYRKLFIEFWQKIDNSISELLNLCEEITTILISDHGFGPQSKCFYLNEWLKREGYLVEVSSAKIATKIMKFVKAIARKSPFVAETMGILSKFLPESLRQTIYSQPILYQVDIDKSRAVSLSTNRNAGVIYLTEENSKLRREIITKLNCLNNSSKISFKLEVYEPEDIWYGKFMDYAPDILVNIEGFEGAIDSSTFSSKLYKCESISPNQTGLHRMNGIFVANGPSVISGQKIFDAQVLDVAPTIIYMMGYIPPDNLDGQVLYQIFTRTFKNQHPNRRIEKTQKKQITEDEEQSDEDVIEHLKDLGYL